MTLDLVIVDDSRLWLSVAERLAKANPLVERVTVFDDAMDAWVYLQICRPQVLMTDIEMPWMNGISFLQMFAGNIPMISSSTKMGYSVLAKEIGCADFLGKPFKRKDFDKAIETVHRLVYSNTSGRKGIVDVPLP